MERRGRPDVVNVRVTDLRGQIATLKVEKESKELAVSAAKLEVEQRLSTDMLSRYRDGLRDGASLSRGAGMLSGSPAVSGLAAGACDLRYLCDPHAVVHSPAGKGTSEVHISSLVMVAVLMPGPERAEHSRTALWNISREPREPRIASHFA